MFIVYLIVFYFFIVFFISYQILLNHFYENLELIFNIILYVLNIFQNYSTIFIVFIQNYKQILFFFFLISQNKINLTSYTKISMIFLSFSHSLSNLKELLILDILDNLTYFYK